MNASSLSQTTRPLQQFVSSHPWWFILILLIIVEIILAPISLLIKTFLLSPRIPAPLIQIIRDLIELSLALVAFVFLWQLRWWRQTGFTRGIRGKDVLVCLFPTLVTFLVAIPGIVQLINGTVKASQGQIVSLAIFACIIGVAEESLFRGLILQTLLPKGLLQAVFLSGLVFGLLHVGNLFAGFPLEYVVEEVLTVFGVGIAYAVIRVRTGSIWPAIILHSLNDFGAFIAISRSGFTHPPLLVALLIGSIVFLIYLLYAAIALRPRKLQEIYLRDQQETPPPQALSTPGSASPWPDSTA
jgi:membrane protease YdiL (CAAX protease family)